MQLIKCELKKLSLIKQIFVSPTLVDRIICEDVEEDVRVNLWMGVAGWM